MQCSHIATTPSKTDTDIIISNYLIYNSSITMTVAAADNFSLSVKPSGRNNTKLQGYLQNSASDQHCVGFAIAVLAASKLSSHQSRRKSICIAKHLRLSYQVLLTTQCQNKLKIITRSSFFS